MHKEKKKLRKWKKKDNKKNLRANAEIFKEIKILLPTITH